MALLGIDEVGRGPWAGPLVMGAVILKDVDADWCAELTDSKKLSAKKRAQLNEVILEKADATALGWVSSQELDEVGLAEALRLATRRAVDEIVRQKVPFDSILLDGTNNFLTRTKYEGITTVKPKADLLIKAVSAASIIAKVARDNYMIKLAEKYPEYGFEKHVGYGTKLHREALAQHGPCPEHRHSFKPIPKPNKNTTNIGQKAEAVVARWLQQQGHTIIARNHKTRFYEIDIVSICSQNIYFTEAKYRKTKGRGTPLENVTLKKQQQMRFAAEAFLKFQPKLAEKYSPILSVAAVSGPDFHLDEWFTLQS